MKESVVGIDKVRKMENSGDFEVEKVVEAIESNKDIIQKVETGEHYICVYMNLGADRRRLVDGIADLYSRFSACSVDLNCDVGIRIFKFWWT